MNDRDSLGAKVRTGTGPTKEFFRDAYDSRPPWDIGRPQRDIMAALDSLDPGGRAIDLGCGTGEHVLALAARGVEAWGIDSTEAAIESARHKARERGLEARFVVGDALDLQPLRQRFELVVDCGLFHVIGDEERRRYVDEVRRVLVPGGVHLMLGFSTNPRDRGPRGYSEDELRACFADGFVVRELRAVTYEVTYGDQGEPAWLSLIERQG
jgi:cyclopropane fatty-acyl-phospholipid synthase-like methyltransferase